MTALLDQGFRVRAVTRDPSSAKAKALAARGVEVVQADLNDKASLETVQICSGTCDYSILGISTCSWA